VPHLNAGEALDKLRTQAGVQRRLPQVLDFAGIVPEIVKLAGI
jgi:hypothetical protein